MSASAEIEKRRARWTDIRQKRSQEELERRTLMQLNAESEKAAHALRAEKLLETANKEQRADEQAADIMFNFRTLILHRAKTIKHTIDPEDITGDQSDAANYYQSELQKIEGNAVAFFHLICQVERVSELQVLWQAQISLWREKLGKKRYDYLWKTYVVIQPKL